jgi:hypothetical protein
MFPAVQMVTKQRVCGPWFHCRETVGVIVGKQIFEMAITGVNSTGRRVQMSPLIFETVHMWPGRQKRVKGTALRGSEHMSDGT